MAEIGKPIPQPSRVMTDADVREIGEVQRKHGVTEKDFMTAFPETHKREYKPDGSYTWTNTIKTNEDGKSTKDNNHLMEMMSPFWRADQERHGKLQSREQLVALKDEAGSAHYVPEYKVEETERRNGWRTHRQVMFLGTAVQGDFCPNCDHLRVWCDCEAVHAKEHQV